MDDTLHSAVFFFLFVTFSFIVLPTLFHPMAVPLYSSVSGVVVDVVITDGFALHDSTQVTFSSGLTFQFDGICQNFVIGKNTTVIYDSTLKPYPVISVEVHD